MCVHAAHASTLMMYFFAVCVCRFCQFLLHLIHLKQLCGEFDDSRCHLNTVSQLLHLHSSKGPMCHEADDLQGACDLSRLPDMPSRSLAAQYVRLYTQWCLSEGAPGRADKMISQFESPGPMSDGESSVQCIWKDILTVLERHANIPSVAQTGPPPSRPEDPSCSRPARSRKKQRPLPSTSLCTSKTLSQLLALSRCDLHLALHAWDQLVLFADAALQPDMALSTSCVAAQIHFAQGVGLFHQHQHQSCHSSVVNTKETPAPKSQRMKKKKGGVGVGRTQPSPSPSAPALESHVAAFLRAHALCSTEAPAVLMREVCRWLAACVTDDTGRLPALFLAQSCGVSAYHRLVGKCHSSEDQNVNTGVSGPVLQSHTYVHVCAHSTTEAVHLAHCLTYIHVHAVHMGTDSPFHNIHTSMYIFRFFDIVADAKSPLCLPWPCTWVSLREKGERTLSAKAAEAPAGHPHLACSEGGSVTAPKR